MLNEIKGAATAPMFMTEPRPTLPAVKLKHEASLRTPTPSPELTLGRSTHQSLGQGPNLVRKRSLQHNEILAHARIDQAEAASRLRTIDRSQAVCFPLGDCT